MSEPFGPRRSLVWGEDMGAQFAKPESTEGGRRDSVLKR